MTEEQESLVRRAEESVAAARVLLDSGFPGIATTRSYYAMFYLASAALLTKGLSFRRHSAVHARFGHDITAAGLLPIELHRWLIDAAAARTLSDYRGDQAIPREDAETYLAQAQRFLEEVRRMLGSLP